MEPLEHHQFIRAQMQVAGEALDRGEYGARERLLQLHCLLETPMESIIRMGWAEVSQSPADPYQTLCSHFLEPARNADCRTAIDLLLFDRMAGFEDGMREINVRDLANYRLHATNNRPVDSQMVSRMMKHLAAMNVVGESGPDTFFLLPLSRALAEQRYKECMSFDHDVLNRAFSLLPRHLQGSKYEYPAIRDYQPCHHHDNTKLSVFQCQLRAETTAFPDPRFYPEIFERLIGPFDPSRGDILVVGIGQVAHVLRRLKTMIPNHAGKMILEDIEGNDQQRLAEDYPLGLSEPFELKFYDIHELGPLTTGAKIYYMRTVLNGLDDYHSLRFLEKLKQALVPGYSIVLIEDTLLPAQDASWPVTTADRLNFLSSLPRKRTEEDYKALIEAAGLKVRKTYRAPLWTTVMELEALHDVDEMEIC